jgi:hypothetical protein
MAALGALCLVAALVLRVAVTPHVAQMPVLPGPDGFSTHVSIGTVTALMDLDTGVEREPIRVTRTETTQGDGAAAAAAGAAGLNVGVFSTLSRVVGGDGRLIREDNYRLAPDRRSAALVDCCGAFVGGVVTPMAGAGYPLRMAPLVPPANYPYFDVNLLRAATMEYLGTDLAGGMRAYKFQQSTPPTKVGRLKVPGRLVGSKEKSTTADRMYTVTRTLWVDPVSGVILRKAERTRETLRNAAGKDVLTLYAATLDSSAEQTAASAAQAKADGSPILWAHTTGPAVLVGFGTLLLLFAGLGYSRARRADRMQVEFPDEWADFDDIRAAGGLQGQETDQ